MSIMSRLLHGVCLILMLVSLSACGGGSGGGAKPRNPKGLSLF